MSERDRIEVRGLRALGHHGALPGEQDRAQPFEIDLDLYLDLARAASSDDLNDTADYGELSLRVAELVATTRYNLLESLAGAIAEAVLTDQRAQRVEVVIRKLRPPIAAHVGTVGVRLERAKDRTVRGA